MQSRDIDFFLCLVEAHNNNDFILLNSLINQKSDLNEKDSAHKTVLMHACECGYILIVELLLKAGADPNLRDNNKDTALIYAINNGNIEIMQLLINAHAIVNVTTSSEWIGSVVVPSIPLQVAIIKNNVPAVKILLEAKADVNSTESYITPLCLAIERKAYEIIQLLLQAGANPSLTPRYDSLTPLMYACRQKDEKSIEMLIAAGANINAFYHGRAPNGTLINMYAYQCDMEVLAILIKHNADVNMGDGFSSPLTLIANRKNLSNTPKKIKVMKLLITAGADINYQDKATKYTALMYAAQEGDIKIVQMLLEYGADVNLTNREGLKALDFTKDPEIINALNIATSSTKLRMTM